MSGGMAGGTIACTIVARNYLPQARVWAESLRACAPDVRPFVLLVDEHYGAAWKVPEPFGTVGIAEIGLPGLEAFLFRYDVTELSTAVKPWLLRALLDRERPAALYYFDPDIQIFRSPAELDGHLGDADVSLTPHLLVEDAPRDPLVEAAVLRAGTYNLGFLGMRDSAASRRLLAWWQERLERDCISSVAEGLFVDQKWIDLAAAGMSRIAVIRDRGCNVAYWNLHQRSVRHTPEGPFVDDEPLRFFHFSGYSPLAPEEVSRHLPGLRLRDRPELRPLFYGYGERLFRAGYHELATLPYGFGFFSDGTPIPLAMRRLFREAERAHRGRWACPRSTGDPDAFPVWAIHQDSDVRFAPLASYLLRERADLREAFPGAASHPEGVAARAFREWFRETGVREYGIPASWFRLAEKRSGGGSRAVAAGDAAGWLADLARRDARLREATDEAGFVRAAEEAAAACEAPALRAAAERWLLTRPLERMAQWYALRADTHGVFGPLWEPYERNRFVQWLLQESLRTGEFGRDEVALLEAFLAGSAARAAGWVARHNSIARSWLVRSEPRPADPSLGRRLEWRLGQTGRVAPRERPGGSFGANFVGFYDAISGVGEAARSTLESARRAEVPSAVQTLPTLTDAHGELALRRDPLGYGVTVFNVNADNMQSGWARTLAETLSDTHRIGVWFWELEDLPESVLESMGRVDEIWARSRFMERSFANAGRRPVRYLPLGVAEPESPARGGRGDFGFRDGEIVFLTSCDAHSFLERKNPWGVVDAFREARFDAGEARLVVRLNNPSDAIVRELYARAGGASLLVLPGNWDRAEHLRVVASADAVVSLHRSEGFGLPMAEALLLGKPVVATAYGGNMDFTTGETAFLVDGPLVPIGKAIGPYPASARWAEPDLRGAVTAMRAIAANRSLAREKAERGRALLRRVHALDVVGAAMRRQLEAAWNRWRGRGRAERGTRLEAGKAAVLEAG